MKDRIINFSMQTLFKISENENYILNFQIIESISSKM